jgi:hypothetical protein
MKKRINQLEKIHDDMRIVVRGIDFPHTRHGRGKWLHTGPNNRPAYSLEQLIYYGEKLREHGMSDADISLMFSDLYWDAFEEFRLNNTYDSFPNLKPKPGDSSAQAGYAASS